MRSEKSLRSDQLSVLILVLLPSLTFSSFRTESEILRGGGGSEPRDSLKRNVKVKIAKRDNMQRVCKKYEKQKGFQEVKSKKYERE